MMYNQITIQKPFNEYITEAVWLEDCQACSNESNTVNTVPHQCYICSEYSPVVKTLDYLDSFVLLSVPFVFILVYNLFFKRKRR